MHWRGLAVQTTGLGVAPDRTCIAMQRTGCAKDRAGVAFQRNGGAKDRAGIAL